MSGLLLLDALAEPRIEEALAGLLGGGRATTSPAPACCP
jgi:hypothetical protein